MNENPLRTAALVLALCGCQAVAQYQFTDQDVGNPGTDPLEPGSVTITGGGTSVTNIAIKAGGSDIWNASSAFHYYYTTVSGCFDVKVRAISLTNSPTTGYANAWVKAELMVCLDDGFGLPNGGDPFIGAMTTRSNTTSSSNIAAGQNEVNVQWRQKRNGGCNWPGTPPSIWLPSVLRPTYPNTWLRLQRLGSIFNVYSSSNNTAWTLVYRANTETDTAWNDPEGVGSPTGWRDTVLVGLGVTSHYNNAGRTAIGTFDQLQFASGLLNSLVGEIKGFTLLAGLSGADYITNFTVLKMDGADILAASSFTNSLSAPTLTALRFEGPVRLVPNSTHTVDVTAKTYFGQTVSQTGLKFTVPYYFTANTNDVVDISTIDTTQPGFTVKSYQTRMYQPNTYRWAEALMVGSHGANIASQAGADANGNFNWTNVLNFFNGSGGYFTSANNFPDADFTAFGIGANPPNTTDNFGLEFFTYMYFPTSGVYQVYVASDDVFYISTSKNPYDRMGTPVMSLATAQMPGFPTAYNISWIIDQPGAYPMRILMENGAGGAGLEMYAAYPQADGTTSYILLNDDGAVSGTPSPIKCYRATAGSVYGPYVKKAIPVRDAQDVVFYQPVVVDIGNGNGTEKQINPSTISLSVDGAAKEITLTPASDGYHIVQVVTNNWAAGNHTNLLGFADNRGTNYTYSWTFRVMGGADSGNLVLADATNAPYAPTIPAYYAATAGQVSQAGFRIRPFQTATEFANDVGYIQEALQGLHGINVIADTNAPFFAWTDLFDFRYSSTTGGGVGQWNYNAMFDAQFGAGSYGATLRFGTGGTLCDAFALDVGAWLVFPTAGTYIMNVNSDDNFLLLGTYGSPLNKLGVPVGAFYGNGRGMTGSQGGVDAGGTSFALNIPAPGAYPFRLVYANGGGDGGLEWSIWQSMPDGSVSRVLINDPSMPNSIKAYQTLAAGDANAPYATYLNPVAWAQDIVAWQPVVVTLADGPGTKTVKTGSAVLKVDGITVAASVTQPEAGKTIISEQLPSPRLAGWHTNVLTFQDNAGVSYTNTWAFSVMNPQPYGIAQVPASSRVDLSEVDLTKPGFLVKVYQTIQTNPPNIAWTEEQFAGLHGPSILQDTGLTNAGPGLYAVQTPIEYAANIAANAQNGEFRYNLPMVTTFGLAEQPVGNNPARNDFCSLMFGGWMVFPKAGTYLMSHDGDDRFKASIASSKDPFSPLGTVIGFVDGSGGTTSGGAAMPNRGNVFHFAFNIPQAGAYPVRMLWYNGTGGESIEWTIYSYLPDGSVKRMLVNDPNEADNVKVYQSLTTPVGPTVTFFGPGSGAVIGTAPALTLTPGNGVTTPVPVAQDFTIMIKDGNTTVKSDSITLTFNGVIQPVQVSQAGGITTVVRSMNDPQRWPSGGYGPLVVTYQDSAGTTYSKLLEYIATPVWGVLTNSMPLSKVDTTKAGFKFRLYQVDSTNTTAAGLFATNGSTTVPTRIHTAEQVLAGLWGPNVANLTNLDEAPYWFLKGSGPSAGTINFKLPGNADQGSFNTTGGNADTVFPGLPGLGASTVNNNRSNNFACEALAYVNFPTNGTYVMGVNSDDGFRLIKGWTAPASIGNLVVNSPAVLAGAKPTVQNSFLTSYSISNAVAGKLVLANGIDYPSTTNGEACVTITNPSELAGNIALIYRSAYCSYTRQIQNAADAGARGVVLVQNRPVGEGPFPQEPGVTPPQAIPAVEIEQVDGDALAAATALGEVNVTINPMEYLINPPTGEGPLGQADVGKGAGDVLFAVDVLEAGVYPLRLTYFQGGGGGSCEFFSLVNGTKVLVNDRAKGGLEAYYALSLVQPAISATFSGSTMTLTYTGILQSNTDLGNPNGWADVQGASSPWPVSTTQANVFFRTRSPN